MVQFELGAVLMLMHRLTHEVRHETVLLDLAHNKTGNLVCAFEVLTTATRK